MSTNLLKTIQHLKDEVVNLFNQNEIYKQRDFTKNKRIKELEDRNELLEENQKENFKTLNELREQLKDTTISNEFQCPELKKMSEFMKKFKDNQ